MAKIALIEKLLVNIFTPFDRIAYRGENLAGLKQRWNNKSLGYLLMLDLRKRNTGTLTNTQRGYCNDLCWKESVAISYLGYHIRKLLGIDIPPFRDYLQKSSDL